MTHPQASAVDPKILARIRALLAKAESTSFAEEAEAYTSKAQWLMTKYSIEQALIDAGHTTTLSAGLMTIVHDSPYASQKATLLSMISNPNGCRSVYTSGTATSTVFGFDHDLTAVELLYTSLLVQAQIEMHQAERAGGFDSSRVRSFRAAFFIGFAQRVGVRLQEIRELATKEAEVATGTEVLPVLVSRDLVVEDAMRTAFPRLGVRRASLSNGQGFTAGQVAGAKADLGPGGARLRRAG
jgi:hypothetical protein